MSSCYVIVTRGLLNNGQPAITYTTVDADIFPHEPRSFELVKFASREEAARHLAEGIPFPQSPTFVRWHYVRAITRRVFNAVGLASRVSPSDFASAPPAEDPELAAVSSN